jgi:hypothetical protein
MTAEEFAEAYARRSGVTVEWLREHGREAKPCECGSDLCEGWQMANIREDEWFAQEMAKLNSPVTDR